MSQLAAVLVYRVCDGKNVNRRARSDSRFGDAFDRLATQIRSRFQSQPSTEFGKGQEAHATV